MTFKLLALDLDGTLLTRTHRVRDDDRRAAAALRDAGVEITIATGRLYGGTLPAARALGMSGSVAVMNGVELVDTTTHAPRFRDGVRPGELGDVRAVVESHSLMSCVFASGGVHLGARHGRYTGFLEIWTPEVVVHADDDAAWACDAPLAVGLCGDDHALDAAARELGEALPNVQIMRFRTFEGEAFALVARSGLDKGTALRALAAERGVSPEDCVVVGDWINDTPMLRAAGHAAVMRGAPDDVAREADVVLEAVRGEGGAVAEVARRVFGLAI
jgi:hypothetical protein